MSDTGIRYTRCRSPHCGGEELVDSIDRCDGLCSTGKASCFDRFFQWDRARGSVQALEVDLASAARSPERSVAIDEWLEAGAP